MRSALLAVVALSMLSLLLPAGLAAAPAPDPCKALAPHLAAAGRALVGGEADGAEAFATFRMAAAASARKGGASALALTLVGLEPGRRVSDAEAPAASCLLRAYVQAAYGERMVRDLQTMVGFRTFVEEGAEEGKEHWKTPEFERQRRWLEQRAGELGLAIKDFDGRMVEVTLPGPKPILAVLTHGDVQGVEGQEWASPPWEARLVGDRIVGRGTEDDKGPIVATLYSLAALDDSGWPLAKTVRLLISNGEESSWQEIPYYLERAPMPDVTFAVDAAYPVTHSQKGYGILTFRVQPPAQNPAQNPTPAAWTVVSMGGGSGMSIVPEIGEAVLRPAAAADAAAAALADLSKRAAAWAAAHPPAKLAVSRDGDLLKVVAHGKGGHSSTPEESHNALTDLAGFLSTLDLRRDAWGSLAGFVGKVVGPSTDGAGLGLRHSDPVMGPLTASLSFLREVEGAPAAQINLRHPRGLAEEEIAKRVAERAAAWSRETGTALGADVQFPSHPHLVPADGPLVSSLLQVWEEVTGTPGRPVAIGGATQARLFQNGVDFGPALSMDHYRGHGPDEYLTTAELRRIAELTVAAVWRLGR